MKSASGSTFSLQSFDFNGWLSQESAIYVTGTLFGGGSISTSFNPDGTPSTSGVTVPYETFLLGAGWNNLTSVTWSYDQGFNGFFLDNIVVNSAVPEPSTYLLFGLGLIGLIAVRRKANA